MGTKLKDEKPSNTADVKMRTVVIPIVGITPLVVYRWSPEKIASLAIIIRTCYSKQLKITPGS